MKNISNDIAFKQNTIKRFNKHGCSIKCRRGLWSVFAGTEADAIKEARHLFFQYYIDGEYIK